MPNGLRYKAQDGTNVTSDLRYVTFVALCLFALFTFIAFLQGHVICNNAEHCSTPRSQQYQYYNNINSIHTFQGFRSCGPISNEAPHDTPSQHVEKVCY